MTHRCQNCEGGTVRGNGWNDEDHCCTDCGGSCVVSDCEDCGEQIPGDEPVCEPCLERRELVEFQETLAANDARSLSDTMGRSLTQMMI